MNRPLTHLQSSTKQIRDCVKRVGPSALPALLPDLAERIIQEPMQVAVLGRDSYKKSTFIQSLVRAIAESSRYAADSLGYGLEGLSVQQPFGGDGTGSDIGLYRKLSADVLPSPSMNKRGALTRSMTENGLATSSSTRMKLYPSNFNSPGFMEDEEEQSESLEVVNDCDGLSPDEGIDIFEIEAEAAGGRRSKNWQRRTNHNPHLDETSDTFSQDSSVPRRYVCTDPDIILWDISDDMEINDRDISEAFDVFVVFSSSPFITSETTDLLQRFQQKKNIIFVNTSVDSPTPGTDTRGRSSKLHSAGDRSYQNLRSYYRSKLFKHSFQDIAMFLISTTVAERYDFPELTRMFIRFHGRKVRHRKRLVQKEINQSITGLAKRLRWESTVWGLMAGLFSIDIVCPYPVVPIIGDLGFSAWTWLKQKCQFGMQAKYPRPEFTADIEPWTYIKLVCQKTPFCLMWVAQRASNKVLQRITNDTTITSMLVGLTAFASCLLVRRTAKAQLNQFQQDAQINLQPVVSSHFPRYLLITPSNVSSLAPSRATSRASSPLSFFS